MAYSSVNKLRLERGALIGDKRSQEALHYANDYDKTIASILFGNDFVNILASTLAAILARDLALQAILARATTTKPRPSPPFVLSLPALGLRRNHPQGLGQAP
jgi:Mg2+/Co2+ transporter CorB